MTIAVTDAHPWDAEAHRKSPSQYSTRKAWRDDRLRMLAANRPTEVGDINYLAVAVLELQAELSKLRAELAERP